MRFIKLVFIILPLFIFSQKPAYCEYNLATGEEEMVFISLDQEIKMGESISKRVEEKMKPDPNYTNQEKINIIGQKVAAVCDRKDLIYRFKVLDNEMENAFALPGGYVYVFKGLFEKLKTDDEIAAVLAHEIGHICARHSVKRLQASLGYTVLKLFMVKGAQDNYSRYKADEAINELLLSYAREDELQADKLAVKYLKKAEYKPEAVIATLDILIKGQMEGPIRSKRYWYTHPYLSERRATVRSEISGNISFDDYMNISEEEDYVIPR